jgi:hypothetical protein
MGDARRLTTPHKKATYSTDSSEQLHITDGKGIDKETEAARGATSPQQQETETAFIHTYQPLDNLQ